MIKRENIRYKVVSFDQLTASEMYEICKVRFEVFVCEQEITCENDFDDKDKKCLHLMAIDEQSKDISKVIGYCRLLPPGLSYEEASIGRVLLLNSYRGTGIAKDMMRKAIIEIEKNYHTSKITLSAQCYIKNLYGSVGFVEASEVYDEAGIPHVKMKL